MVIGDRTAARPVGEAEGAEAETEGTQVVVQGEEEAGGEEILFHLNNPLVVILGFSQVYRRPIHSIYSTIFL